MDSISDQALRAFLRGKVDLFEKHVRGLKYDEAGVRTRVQAAKDFVSFLFGGQPGRRRQPPRPRRSRGQAVGAALSARGVINASKGNNL
jgi:hypothetical protein